MNYPKRPIGSHGIGAWPRWVTRGDDRERGDVPGWVLVTLMTAGLVLKLREAGGYIPPDVARWGMDRLADAPEDYDPFEEIRLEYASNGAIAI